MAERAFCGCCKELSESIPTTLKCHKCGVEHIYDNTFKTYLPKAVVCASCHKTSTRISTDYRCEKCKARYDAKPEYSLADILGSLVALIIFVGTVLLGVYEIARHGDTGQGIVFILFGGGFSLYFINGFYNYFTKPNRTLVLIAEITTPQAQPVQEKPAGQKPTKEQRMAEMQEKVKTMKNKSVAVGKTQVAAYAPKPPKAARAEKPGEKNWLGAFVVAIIFLAIAGGIYIWLDSGGKMGWTKVEVSDVSFSVPSDWTVDKYSDPDFVVTVIGPDEGNSRPNFNIQQSFGYIDNFDYEVSEGKKGLELGGAQVQSQYKTTEAGKETAVYIFRSYISDKGYYSKGKALLIKVNSNELVMIVFASKESTYWKNVAIFDQILNTLKFK